MKVTLSCIGKFHHFDLARQLNASGLLGGIYTGYPRSKVSGERLPPEKIFCLPGGRLPFLAYHRHPVLGGWPLGFLDDVSLWLHDTRVASRLRSCDVFVGLSGHNTRAGERARLLGAKWVCDRGSTHIVYQEKVLREECVRWKVPHHGVRRRALEHEAEEYEKADFISVPSRFVEETFVSQGVPRAKLKRIAYGVELKAFQPVAQPVDGEFNIIFVGQVSVRKGIPYLIEAYRKFKHPKKTLTLIGRIDPTFKVWVDQVREEGIRFLGHVPQPQLKEHLSRSHAFVLPSIEEGLALVQAQALACGCPVICTPNTGGGDIFESGKAGFVVPARDPAVLVERLELLSGDLALQKNMRAQAVRTVQVMGGWDAYGAHWIDFLTEITAQPAKPISNS